MESNYRPYPELRNRTRPCQGSWPPRGSFPHRTRAHLDIDHRQSSHIHYTCRRLFCRSPRTQRPTGCCGPTMRILSFHKKTFMQIPLRSASLKSSIIPDLCFRHSSQASTPFLRILRCSSLAMRGCSWFLYQKMNSRHAGSHHLIQAVSPG